MRRIYAGAAAATLTLVVLQWFQPPVPTPRLPDERPIEEHLAVPDQVDRLLRAACYDCHSGETRWPWYGRLSPISWLIADDVQHGRDDLDFDHWATDPDVEPTPLQRLRWICRDMRQGIMPPRSYLLLHPEARLGDDGEELICAWAERSAERLEAEYERRGVDVGDSDGR